MLAFAIGLIPAILLYIFPANAPVPFFAFILVLFLFLIALWVCIKLYLDIKDQETTPTIPIIECREGICICKANDFLTTHSIVSFYEKNGKYQKQIGYGMVDTIVSGHFAQIKVQPNDGAASNFITYISDNKEKIIIRPTITTDTLQQINTILNMEVYNEIKY